MEELPPNRDNARITKSMVKPFTLHYYEHSDMWEVIGGKKLAFGTDPYNLAGFGQASTEHLSSAALVKLQEMSKEPMITSKDAFNHYGDPHAERGLSVVAIPAELLAANPALPKRIYANNDIHKPLLAALRLLQQRKLLAEIKAFSGCFNIRAIRGAKAMSLHSWALAVDFNAYDNPLGYTYDEAKATGRKPFTEQFLQCWRETGWHCGGDWTGRPDRQHFELAKLPA